MTEAAWDWRNPPEQPPPGCPHPERWTEAHREYRRHQANPYGWCGHRFCADEWPCAGYRLAVRSLLDACADEPPHIPLPGPPRWVELANCAWCGRGIGHHSLWGWLHLEAGFILCVEPREDSPPLCRAEPGVGTAAPTVSY